MAAIGTRVDEDALEDFVLANSPEYVKARKDAESAVFEGRTRPAREIFDEIRAKKRTVSGHPEARMP